LKKKNSLDDEENKNENNGKLTLPSSYMNMLNMNISNIIKENEEKYQKLEEENTRLKQDLNENVESLMNLKNKEEDRSEIEVNRFNQELINMLADKLNKNILNILQQNIKFQIENGVEIFQKTVEKNTNQSNVEDISKMFVDTQTNLVKAFEIMKKDIVRETVLHKNEEKDPQDNCHKESSLDNQVQSILSKQSLQTNIISDLISSVEEVNDEVKGNNKIFMIIENIINSVSENVDEILNEKLEEIKDDFCEIYTKNIESLQSCNDTIFEELESINEEISFIKKGNKEIKSIIKEEFETVSSDLIDKSNELISSKVDSLLKSVHPPTKRNYSDPNRLSFTKSHNYSNFLTEKDINFIVKSPQSKYAYALQQNIQEITKSQYSILLKEIDTLSKLNQAKKKNFSGLLEKLRETYFTIQIHLNNTIPLKITELNEFFIQELNSLEISFEKNYEELNSSSGEDYEISTDLLKISINKIISDKLEVVEKTLEDAICKKLSEIYDLKWCGECSKVDYFFGFINCEICKKENCKNCVVLCQGCNKLYCNKCSLCTQCSQFYCRNCRLSCSFCEIEEKEKLCPVCIVKCPYCKKETCKDCKRVCSTCSTGTCGKCSKTCNICLNSSCSRCDSFNTFKYCFFCKKTSCSRCVVTCSSCDYEVCKSCLINCKDCKKIICRKCAFLCEYCPNKYCNECSLDKKKVSCNLCQKVSCNSCLINFKNCKKCDLDYCKNCCSVCKKCKALNCNNCNINCDSCKEFACYACMYKCMCDEFVFCDSCLKGNEPIGPHECVYFINEAPTFSGIKTRTKYALPKNFEAKIHLQKFESTSLLVGITDNNEFIENSVTFIDNVWTFKVKTGEKYSSSSSLQPYLPIKQIKEGDSIIIAIRNGQLFFRVNYDETEPAFTINANKKYYLYIENDTPSLLTRVALVYIRKI